MFGDKKKIKHNKKILLGEVCVSLEIQLSF